MPNPDWRSDPVRLGLTSVVRPGTQVSADAAIDVRRWWSRISLGVLEYECGGFLFDVRRPVYNESVTYLSDDDHEAFVRALDGPMPGAKRARGRAGEWATQKVLAHANVRSVPTTRPTPPLAT